MVRRPAPARESETGAAALAGAFEAALRGAGRGRARAALVRHAFGVALRLAAEAQRLPRAGSPWPRAPLPRPARAGAARVERALASAAVDWAAVTPEALGDLREALGGARGVRRRRGTFYTPPAIARAVVDRALGPVVADVLEASPARPDRALLALTIVDPACGSGHLLLEAARQLAGHVARARAGGGGEAPAAAVRRALREVVRRCVFGVDVDPLAADLCRAGLWLAAGGVAPEAGHVRAGESLLGVAWGPARFDVAVANPPWGAALGARASAAVRARYVAARSGKLDSSIPFTELAVRLVRPGGRVGLVLPDILLLKAYPGVRRFLVEETALEELAHWGLAFRGVGLDACTVVARVGAPGPEHAVRCVPEVGDGGPDGSPSALIRQRVFAGNREHRFNLGLSPEVEARLEALRAAGPPAGEVFTIREGVHSGNVRARLFLDRPDGPRCRPLIFGRGEIAAGRLRWAGRWIQLDPSRFDAAAGDYLNLGDPALYERPKLLVRRTGDHVLAAPDLEGRWCSNNFFLLVPKAPMTEAELLRACDALNAPEATEYFRLLQPRTGRRFAELKITHLKEIPLAGFPPPPGPAPAPAAAGP
ncbi:MAG: N-6 DNA methylase [Anaeromyxobacter sp.]